MDSFELKQKTLSGVIWKYGERILAQLVTFVVSIVIARILVPEDYGVVAIVTTLINLLNVFVTSGYGAALIQKKDSDDRDFNSIFTFSGALSLVFCVGLFFLAPVVANFYDIPILTLLIRVMSLRLPIAAFNSVQHAYIAKKMQFRKFFLATIIGTVISAIVGITMALCGCGVWALVGQYFTNTCVDSIVLFICFKWRYRPYYSHKLAKPLIKYGSKVLCAGFIDTLYQELRTLIIGKKFSTESLAYYNRSEQFPKLFVLNLSTAIDGTLMPALCKIQDNLELMKNAVRRAVQVSTFVVFPLMAGMIAVAGPMVEVLLTSKWLSAVPLIQIFCVSYMFNPIRSVSMQATKALGKSGLYLMIETVQKLLSVILLLFSLKYGIIIVTITVLITSFLACLVNSIVIMKLLRYSILSQVLDCAPQLLLSGIMCISVYVLKFVIVNVYLLLALQLVVGVLIYIVLAYLFKLEAYKYFFNTLKKFFKKGDKK